MKAVKFNHISPIIGNLAYVILGIFSIVQHNDFLNFALFALMFLQIIDLLYNVGLILSKSEEWKGVQPYIKITIDVVVLIIFGILFSKSINAPEVDMFNKDFFNSILYKICVIAVFGPSIVATSILAVKMFLKKNNLAYIFLINTILSCLMVFFFVHMMRVTNSDSFLMFGAYSVAYGIVNILLIQYIYHQKNDKKHLLSNL